MSKNYPASKKGCDGCFSGSLDETLVQIKNPPGLSYLRYRIGTHRTFKENMFASLSSTLVTGISPDSNEKPNAPLESLTTRSDDDLIISLFDAWATVADVLTFYQERIANEGFLRTSTDRRSILELGRAVGYELGPGVAANTFLAFTLDESPETTQKRTIIAKGIKVQSVPAQGELPQIFETIEEIEADPEWNELRPRLTEPQIIDENTKRLYLQKIDAQIKQGNKLLVQLTRDNSYTLVFESIADILTDDNLQLPYTEIIPQQSLPRNNISGSSALALTSKPDEDKMVNDLLKRVAKTFDIADLQNNKEGWTQNDLVAFAVTHQLPRKKFFELFNYHAQIIAHDPATKNHVYSFKLRASLFGHNAPAFNTLSSELQRNMGVAWQQNGESSGSGPNEMASAAIRPPPWSWDNPLLTIKNYSDHRKKMPGMHANIYLDNNYPGIVPKSWIVLEPAKPAKPAEVNATPIPMPYVVSVGEVSEITLADFTLSTKVTALILEDFASAGDPNATVPQPVWSDFLLRETTVHAQSNELELSPDRPYNYDGTSTELSLQDNIVILDHVVDGLNIGQPISIIGALVDSPKDIRTEIAFIDEIDLSGDKHHTKLRFKENFANQYDVKTLKLNANVSRATHGETKQEVIGSSDPSKSQQEFVLKQKPLTYTSSAGKKGVNTTLEVYVDGVKWNEVPALSNLRQDEHGYIVRTDTEGTVHIIFGAKGARPPAGIENVKAKYRIGIGKSGMLKENQLKLLVDRPLGIRSVTNPTKPTDGDDPEDIASARQNASISATNMGRLISAGDFENFAQSFMGIGDAKAVQTWDGKETVVHITVASASGNPVDPASNLFSSLAKAISDSKDPRISFYLDTFTPKSFSLEVNVQVTPDRDPMVIQSEIEDLLHAEFAYTSRQFGQSVTQNDIVVAIQRIEGVIMIDVKHLYESSKPESKDATKDALTCNIAYWDNYSNRFVRSELLTIHPDSGQNAVYVTVYVAGESFRR